MTIEIIEEESGGKTVLAGKGDSDKIIQEAYNKIRDEGLLAKVIKGGIPITRDEDDELEENWSEMDS